MRKILTSFIDAMAAIFMPVINVLSAAGLMKAAAAVLVMTGVLSDGSETFLVLNALCDTVYYFLPVMISITAADKFGTDRFISLVLACLSLYPSLNQMLESGQTVHFLGIPLIGATYHSSVIPVILSIIVLKYLEKLADKIIPDLIKGFMKPIVCITIMGIVELAVFGPLGTIIGDAIASAYQFIYNLSPAVAGALLGGIIQPMVVFGVQWPVLLLAMNNVAVNGTDTILAVIGPAVFGQAGAAIAVFIKNKDKKFRATSVPAIAGLLISGVTEPVLYGITLPHKKPLISGAIGGALGGALAGIAGSRALAFSFPALINIPVYIGQGFELYLVGCLIGFITGFVLTMILDRAEYKVVNNVENKGQK